MDHYEVLGLSSVESVDCTKLTEAEIKAAYRKKALELHPDKISKKRKRDGITDDSDTVSSMTAAFQQLQSSYEVLMDKEARKRFDVVWLRRKQKKVRTGKMQEGMARKERERGKSFREQMRMARERMMSMRKELERIRKKAREWEMNVRKEKERQRKMEREWEESERVKKEMRMKVEREREENERKEEEAIKKVQEEERLVYEKKLKRIHDEENVRVFEEVWRVKARILRVTWNKVEFGEFSKVQIRDMFEVFGEVKEVRINKDLGKNGHALILMGSKQSVVAATVAKWVNHPKSPFLVRPLTLC
ncbi:golgin subfamily A member 6-like protein 6 [Chenopodium quinoa]|uniref:J domain-containing protein n=1 Tax=Chenopodium quinoa TaxID=63459 RepID=A0A803LHP2_CHEQI|nr:golgin subfamily A member 6-like protein 6 [Chenopodium quinoa]